MVTKIFSCILLIVFMFTFFYPPLTFSSNLKLALLLLLLPFFFIILCTNFKSMIHDTGPYKGGFFLMHVASSSSKCKVAMSMTMVNDPLRRIGRCDQKKEAISGSEIGADNSPAGAASF